MQMSDEKPLEGRVALITGAGRGLGRAYAQVLAAHGAEVAVNNRSPESAHSAVAEIVAAGGNAVACAGDLESPGVPAQVVAETISAFGRLDIVVNNAGGAEADNEPFAATTTQAREAVMRQNFATAWDVSQAAWPHLVANGYGRIVLTASPIAVYGAPGFSHYAAAKGAIIGLSQTMSAEGAEHGITVNVLNPLAATSASGMPDNDFSRWYSATFGVDHVAAALAWLVDERCTVTGKIFSLGGRRVAEVAISESAGFLAPGPLADSAGLGDNFDAVFNGGEGQQFGALGEFMGFVSGLHQ
jgi:NAD(P)-dependent dehydrogenase (short-subunit alcohol dehydrogenase family)